jgi:hypothetical protein
MLARFANRPIYFSRSLSRNLSRPEPCAGEQSEPGRGTMPALRGPQSGPATGGAGRRPKPTVPGTFAAAWRASLAGRSDRAAAVVADEWWNSGNVVAAFAIRP